MIKTLVKGLFHLIYPSLCISCRLFEPFKESDFCLSCINNLPFVESPDDSRAACTGKEFFPEDVTFFNALFYFSKDGLIADMIHRIKYKGQYRLARKLGKHLGASTQKHDLLSGFTIVPIPIHPKRRAERGFNQSEEIAKGVAEVMELPIENNVLRRTEYEQSQTSKDKYDRTTLLLKSFDLNYSYSLPKKVLLVDDVVTTGSTLAACSQILLRHDLEKIGVISLGVSI